MTTPLRLKGFIEELQDYIAANYTDDEGRSYVVAENFTIGEVLDVEDLDNLLGSNVDLTIYDQANQIVRTGRRFRSTRGVRFLFKGEHAQASLDRGHDMVAWLSGLDQIELTSFHVWVERFQRPPGIVTGRPSGTFLSDCVIHFLAINRT